MRTNVFFSVLAVLCSVLMMAAPSDLRAAQSASCWHDYPIPTTPVDYRHSLAAETLAPDRISLNGKPILLGVSEDAITRVVGTPSTAIEPWQQRTRQQQCDYLLELLKRNPD